MADPRDEREDVALEAVEDLVERGRLLRRRRREPLAQLVRGAGADHGPGGPVSRSTSMSTVR